jgi:UDP-4-amino-4-deoxy-L-arabinose formyltransferase/UDP-glucuronic acid dehydrogenase (UDP-4-keto-hexauronic acid decarboxylating)
MNVLLVGEESAGIQTLNALTRSDHRIVAVMASPTKKSLSGSTLWQVAEQLGQPTWPAALVKDPAFAGRIRDAEVDIILNAHSLFIMHGEVVEAPRIGSFNLHPGPLPGYAGLNVISWALYRGERTHGVTIHKMAAGIDTGPIVYQSLFDIESADTALTLYARCTREGVALLLQLLETASRDENAIPLSPQDLTQRRYFGKDAPENGRVNWSRPAREIVNLVRACDYYPFPSPWGFPRARLGEREIGVIKARLTGETCDAAPGTVGRLVGTAAQVACADEWVLMDKALVEGRYLPAADILQSGARLENGI